MTTNWKNVLLGDETCNIYISQNICKAGLSRYINVDCETSANSDSMFIVHALNMAL